MCIYMGICMLFVLTLLHVCMHLCMNEYTTFLLYTNEGPIEIVLDVIHSM
jgi:hypothetical protein